MPIGQAMTKVTSLEIAARIWGDSEMKFRIMDAQLAEVIALLLFSRYGCGKEDKP